MAGNIISWFPGYLSKKLEQEQSQDSNLGNSDIAKHLPLNLNSWRSVFKVQYELELLDGVGTG